MYVESKHQTRRIKASPIGLMDPGRSAWALDLCCARARPSCFNGSEVLDFDSERDARGPPTTAHTGHHGRRTSQEARPERPRTAEDARGPRPASPRARPHVTAPRAPAGPAPSSARGRIKRIGLRAGVRSDPGDAATPAPDRRPAIKKKS